MTLKPGKYIATILKVTPVEGDHIDYNTGDDFHWYGLRFYFKVSNKTITYQVYTAKDESSYEVETDSKLSELLNAFGGIKKIKDTDMLIGKQCRVNIINITEPHRYIKNKQNIYNRISAINPI